MSFWTSGASLNTPRLIISAITLQDGRVLTVGGWLTTSAPSATCEISSVDGSSWSSTGSLPTPLDYSRLVLLSNGNVLSIGGSANNGAGASYSFVSEYNPGTGLWTSKTPMSIPRYGFGCWTLPSGNILVAGGWNQDTSATTSLSEIYDPVADTWTPTGSFNIARFFGGDNLSGSGKPVYIGGGTSNTTVTNTIEVYNVGSGTWNLSSASLPNGFGTNFSGGNASVTLNDGSILWTGCDILAAILSGGTPASKKTGVFDADADTFTVKGDLALPTAGQVVFSLPNGDALIAGGFGGRDTDPTTNKVQRYNHTPGFWNDEASLPLSQIPGQWQGPVLLQNQHPFIIGADSETGTLPNTYIFHEGSMAITQVQKKGTDTGGTSHTVTLSATTHGNILIVLVATNSGADNHITAMSDNDGGGAGNTYTHILADGSANSGGIFVNTEIWYAKNIIGGGSAVTITATTSGSASNFFMEAIEYSGVSTTSPVEVFGNTSNQGVTSTLTGPSLTIANGNDVLLTSGATSGGYPSGVSAPWTAIANDDVPSDTPVAELIGPGAGTYAAVFTPVFSGQGCTSGAAFTATSSGPSAKKKASTNLII